MTWACWRLPWGLLLQLSMFPFSVIMTVGKGKKELSADVGKVQIGEVEVI